MSNAIPKEKQSAYQRWELASFGDERVGHTQVQVQTAEEVARQNADLLATLRENAREQGYVDGLDRGRAEGLEAGRAQAAEELHYLRDIMNGFGAEVAQANDVIANDMLNLALDLAKAMLKTALNVRPALVLPIVSEAIRYLPSLQQPALLFLHPEDAELVRHHMSDELAKSGWRVAEDAQMERGGCRVETATNQIDAIPAVRWQRIAEGLGQQSDWLE